MVGLNTLSGIETRASDDTLNRERWGSMEYTYIVFFREEIVIIGVHVLHMFLELIEWNGFQCS